MHGVSYRFNHLLARAESFVKTSISVENSGYLAIFDRTLDLILKKLTDAYFESSNYLDWVVDEDRERIDLIFTDGMYAEHKEVGPFWHQIHIPISYLEDMEHLDAALHAESRHAIHHNLHHDRGVSFKHSASKAGTIISETVHQGTDFPLTIPDRFGNDFDFVQGDVPYHCSAYILGQLSPQPLERQIQVQWLARQTIREHKVDSDLYRLTLSEREFDPLQAAFDFHRGRRDPLRTYAYKEYPFEGCKFEGMKKNYYASQLDYILLRLATSSIDALHKEIRV
ncbi:hypothetical protein H6504_04895 [Candidatus Woesearchaeota archaeon]|nr:hypothetical protein [Candidatus Woesearchaeota archaeon]